jgi:hypothetical protein
MAYAGPTSMEEWKGDGNRNAWSYKKGALYGVESGTIGRDVKLPDVANIEFDLAWRGQLYFNLGFGFDDYKQIYKSSGYTVQFSHSSIYLQRYRVRQGSSGYVGSNVEMQELQRKTKMRCSIRVSKPQKLVVLYIDGKLVKQWNESEEWTAKGPGLILISQGQGQLRVSDISVTGWDGRLDSDPGAAAKDADLIRLGNGDKVSGTVKKLVGGQIAFQTSFAEMNVPAERIAVMEFASQKSERARRQRNDVRAFFPDGASVTLALDKMDEQDLVGSTENCLAGKVTAVVGAFQRIRFNIYEKSEDAGDDDGWGGGAGGIPVMIDE